MSSPSFSDLNLDEFEDTISKSVSSDTAAFGNLELKRTISFERQISNDIININDGTNISSTKDITYISKRQKQNSDSEHSIEERSKWDSIYDSLNIVINDITTIADIRNSPQKMTKKMLLQIVSIKKTETGYLCSLSDKTGSIQGTFNNAVVKKNRQYLEIGSIIVADSIPILSIVQSGNRYLILTEKCVKKVIPS